MGIDALVKLAQKIHDYWIGLNQMRILEPASFAPKHGLPPAR